MSKTLALLCGLVWVLHSAAAAPATVDELLSRYQVPETSVGSYIAPINGTDAPTTINAGRAFNPASVIKLLPTLAALETLSPAFQWSTPVYASGALVDGRLVGDLYIQGGGDPYLTVESLWALLRNVRAQGVERISGDIVIDNGVFAPAPFDRAAFDGKPYRLYNGPAGGLMINFWAVRFTIRAHQQGVTIDAFPDSGRLEIVNEVRHSGAACSRARRRIGYRVQALERRTRVTFTGTLSSRCPPVVMSRAVIPSDQYAAYVLPTLWRRAGGTLDGTVRHGRVADTARRLFAHPSRSLAEVVRATNKFSNNMMARHLLLTLGMRYRDRGIGVDDGRRALTDWLLAHDLALPKLNIVNGAGLARDTRISAAGLAGVLRAGFHSRYAPEFMAALPIAGQDGSLRRRDFKQHGDATVRLKTGLIDDVRALAGYVRQPGGRYYVVVLLVNHPGIHREVGSRLQDAIVRYVLELK